MPEAITEPAGSKRLSIVCVGSDTSGEAGLSARLMQALRPTLDSGAQWLNLVLAEELDTEHAFELRDAELVLFVTADAQLAAPWELRELSVGGTSPQVNINDPLTPDGILRLCHLLSRRQAAPTCFALGVCTESGANADLSAASTTHLDDALELIAQLLADPDAARWRELASGAGA